MNITSLSPSQSPSNGPQPPLFREEQHVPPHIRAVARALCSADAANYPKLCALASDLSSVARDAQKTEQIIDKLRCITTEIQDGVPLSPHEFTLFLREYVTCHELLLPMVSHLEQVSDTLLGRTLALTTEIDRLCVECGALTAQIFPVLKEIHCFFMEMMSSKTERNLLIEFSRDQILHKLLRFLCALLEKGLVALSEYQRHVECVRADPIKPVDASGTSVNGLTTSGDGGEPPKVTDDDGQGRLEKPPNAVGTVIPEPDAKAELQRVIADALACRPLFDAMPYDLADALCSVHADLQVHFSHIRWYFEVALGTSSKDGTLQTSGVNDGERPKLSALAEISDLSILRIWSAAVGDQPACEVQHFKEALLPKLVPECLWNPVLEVLNYRNCGVVSLFSLNRLLKVWGPLVAMEENFGQCVQKGFLSLVKPFEYWRWMFARRPDATVGDYLVALTANPGEAYVMVLNKQQSTKGTGETVRHGSKPFHTAPSINTRSTSKVELPEVVAVGVVSELRLVSYPLSQETGLWVIVGMARKMFDSIADACVAFPSLFRRPCGDPAVLSQPCKGSLVSALGEFLPDKVAPASIEGLTLHHACYHGNTRCVRMLLLRGAATIVNCAVVDPSVSPGFCWTPLLCAVNTPYADPVEVVRMLLDAAADVHYTDDAACTALYYAIANGYAGSVSLLLQRCPTLQTSPTTVPLVMALGANSFLPRSSDIQRLADVIPIPSVVAAILPTVRDYDLVYLAARILQRIAFVSRERGHESTNAKGRLPDTEMLVVNLDEPHSFSDWDAPDAQLMLKYLPMGQEALEIRTDGEISCLSQIFQNHDKLCRAHLFQMHMVLRMLLNHCFVVSVQNAFREGKDEFAVHTSSGI